jgi:D-amino-acid dehydrogenase
MMRELGCDIEMLDARRCVEVEPALRDVRLAGGSYSATDESGDAHKFTRALAALCAQCGVQFRAGRISGLHANGGRIAGVALEGAADLLRADAYLVCLGSYSPLYLRALGIRLAIYPLKGYSVTLPVVDESRAYTVSLTDDEHKLVFSRLGARLRIAGTAELNGYNTQLNEVRCRAILRRTLELFPGAGDPERVHYIGATRYPNLYLNTGHGTLGWTHACGSGHAIADIVSGRKPEIELAFTGLSSIRPMAAGGASATPARVRAR